MLRLPLALLAATLAALVVAATHTPTGRCDSEGYPALGIVEVTGGDPSSTSYVDDRNYLLANGFWVYIETNNIWTAQGPGVHTGDVTAHNLQRGGGETWWPDDHEICVDDPNVVPDLYL